MFTIGERTHCKRCGQDLEYTGGEHPWRDRGSNWHCHIGQVHDPELLQLMTADRWHKMTPAQRDKVRDNSEITKHQLANWQGWRVEVVDLAGERRRFIVGRSTGWRPCLLEIKTSRSTGGGPVDATYASFTPIRKVRESVS